MNEKNEDDVPEKKLLIKMKIFELPHEKKIKRKLTNT